MCVTSICYPNFVVVVPMYELVCDIVTFGDIFRDLSIVLPSSVRTVSIGTGWGGVGDAGVSDDASPLPWNHPMRPEIISVNGYPGAKSLILDEI